MAIGSTQPSVKRRPLPDELPAISTSRKRTENSCRTSGKLPQCILLTQCLWPVLETIHPDRHFAIGQTRGIYWTLTDPPERGAICPDWFYVAGVPPDLDGHYRRSYVLWKEHIAPSVVLEFASDDRGSRSAIRRRWKASSGSTSRSSVRATTAFSWSRRDSSTSTVSKARSTAA